MKTIELDTGRAVFPQFAAAKQRQQNAENASTYSHHQRATAQTALDLLDMAYAYDKVFINYRKTFICVKMDSPKVKDKKLAAEIEGILSDKNMVKVITPQSILYRLYRSK